MVRYKQVEPTSMLYIGDKQVQVYRKKFNAKIFYEKWYITWFNKRGDGKAN